MLPRLSVANIWLLVVAINVGRFFRTNPLIYGTRSGLDPPSSTEFYVYQDHPVLDKILARYRTVIGDDYERYRNHCLRVLSYSLHFLKKENRNAREENVISEADIDAMATALAYHDIALWTDGKLNYLEPSVEVFDRDLRRDREDRLVAQNQEDDSATFESLLPSSLLDSDVLVETVRETILNHHRYSIWKGGESPAKASLVNAVRSADWADASFGVFRSSLPVNFVEAAFDQNPSLGFHLMLANMGSRLSPNSFIGRLDVLKIFKW